MAVVRSLLSRLGLNIHPDKTFIGRIAKGFYFLGYHFFEGTLSAAQKTLDKMAETGFTSTRRAGMNPRLLCGISHAGAHGSGVGLVTLNCSRHVFRLSAPTPLSQQGTKAEEGREGGEAARCGDFWDGCPHGVSSGFNRREIKTGGNTGDGYPVSEY
jgi:hypothetical protein